MNNLPPLSSALSTLGATDTDSAYIIVMVFNLYVRALAIRKGRSHLRSEDLYPIINILQTLFDQEEEVPQVVKQGPKDIADAIKL